MVLATDARMQYRHVPAEPGTVMEFRIYGIILLMNLETEPMLVVNAALKEAGFVAFPLYGKRRRRKFTLRLIPPEDAA